MWTLMQLQLHWVVDLETLVPYSRLGARWKQRACTVALDFFLQEGMNVLPSLHNSVGLVTKLASQHSKVGDVVHTAGSQLLGTVVATAQKVTKDPFEFILIVHHALEPVMGYSQLPRLLPRMQHLFPTSCSSVTEQARHSRG